MWSIRGVALLVVCAYFILSFSAFYVIYRNWDFKSLSTSLEGGCTLATGSILQIHNTANYRVVDRVGHATFALLSIHDTGS